MAIRRVLLHKALGFPVAASLWLPLIVDTFLTFLLLPLHVACLELSHTVTVQYSQGLLLHISIPRRTKLSVWGTVSGCRDGSKDQALGTQLAESEFESLEHALQHASVISILLAWDGRQRDWNSQKLPSYQTWYVRWQNNQRGPVLNKVDDKQLTCLGVTFTFVYL